MILYKNPWGAYGEMINVTCQKIDLDGLFFI